MVSIKNKLDEIIKDSDEVTKKILLDLKKSNPPENFDLLGIVNQISKDAIDKILEKSENNDALGALVLLGLIRVYADTISRVIKDDTIQADASYDIYL